VDEEGFSQLASLLQQGVDAISQQQEVEFRAYSRVVLPIDRYVYYQLLKTLKVRGALTYTQETDQSESETYDRAIVMFTCEQPVQEFSDAPVKTIYVGKVRNFRYAFDRQNGFFSSAKLWHYVGHSLPPVFTRQLLDVPGAIDPSQAVVSNSLPFWLQLNNYRVPFPTPPAEPPPDLFTNNIQLYPADLVDANLAPPYGSVMCYDTRGQGLPLLDRNRNQSQLCFERVRVTLKGLQNNAAQDFLSAVLQYSSETGNFGILQDIPTIVDSHRTDPALLTLAMEKTIEFSISYYQTRAAAIARQLITDCAPTIYLGTELIQEAS